MSFFLDPLPLPVAQNSPPTTRPRVSETECKYSAPKDNSPPSRIPKGVEFGSISMSFVSDAWDSGYNVTERRKLNFEDSLQNVDMFAEDFADSPMSVMDMNSFTVDREHDETYFSIDDAPDISRSKDQVNSSIGSFGLKVPAIEKQIVDNKVIQNISIAKMRLLRGYYDKMKLESGDVLFDEHRKTVGIKTSQRGFADLKLSVLEQYNNLHERKLELSSTMVRLLSTVPDNLKVVDAVLSSLSLNVHIALDGNNLCLAAFDYEVVNKAFFEVKQLLTCQKVDFGDGVVSLIRTKNFKDKVKELMSGLIVIVTTPETNQIIVEGYKEDVTQVVSAIKAYIGQNKTKTHRIPILQGVQNYLLHFKDPVLTTT